MRGVTSSVLDVLTEWFADHREKATAGNDEPRMSKTKTKTLVLKDSQCHKN